MTHKQVKKIINILSSSETRKELAERTGYSEKTLTAIFSGTGATYKPITDAFNQLVYDLSTRPYVPPKKKHWEPPTPEPRVFYKGEEIGQIAGFKLIYESRERETT